MQEQGARSKRQAVHSNKAKTRVHDVCYTWNEAEMSSQQTLRKRKTVPNVLPVILICTKYPDCGLVPGFKCTACM